MLDKSSLIKKYLKILGRSIAVSKEDGSEDCVFAVIRSLWAKNKAYFEENQLEIGRVYNEYCQYIGPSDLDITALTKRDVVVCGDVKYIFVKAEAVKTGNKVQYYSGILKRVWEDDDNAYI